MEGAGKVAIGVPVYNGAATLRRALDNLRNQTYRDIEVIISDNASTDDSFAIAQEFVDADARFRLIRRDTNVGPVLNFFSLLEMTEAGFFMWRADDDWSELDYVEKLVSVFRENPRTKLAASESLFVLSNGKVAGVNRFSTPTQRLRSFRVGHMLMNLSASSIYGLWHRSTLMEVLARTKEAYPYVWAWDYMAMMPIVLAEAVSGTNETKLYRDRPETRRYSAKERAETMWEMRRAFRKACFAELRRVDWPIWEKALVSPYLFRYANVRVYRFWKTVRRQLRQLIGK